MHPGETDKEPLDAVEGNGPTAIKSKWQVKHAYIVKSELRNPIT